MNLAIIGATGNVGRKTYRNFRESRSLEFIYNLYLVASSKSEGQKI